MAEEDQLPFRVNLGLLDQALCVSFSSFLCQCDAVSFFPQLRRVGLAPVET
jgi:hypothetical protein